MTVELVYERDCPNIPGTRANLLKAFGEAGLPPAWTEWDRTSPDAPPHVRAFGSPAVLVNGQDVGAFSPREEGSSCRVYQAGGGHRAGEVPSDLIRDALLMSTERSASSTVLMRGAAVIPGIGFSLLPKLACPACWPAYAALLSSIGLGFLISTTYLLPLTAVFLLAAVGALAFRAKRRRGYGPTLLGAAAATVVLFGKFYLESNSLMYSGLGILVAASLWNSWPFQRRICATEKSL